MPEFTHDTPWCQRVSTLSHGVIDAYITEDLRVKHLQSENVEQFFLVGEAKPCSACTTLELLLDVGSEPVVHLRQCLNNLGFGLVEVDTGQQ